MASSLRLDDSVNAKVWVMNFVRLVSGEFFEVGCLVNAKLWVMT